MQWRDDKTPSEWRQAFLEAFAKDEAADGDDHERTCECLQCECLRASIATSADSINTGFYVNSYTTKQCPTMEGVLENLRQGLARLEEQREKEREDNEQARLAAVKAIGRPLDKEEEKQFKGKTVFQETMRTINRLNSSYRRCYWKSGSEMIFPILYGHMTFSSHRCWTVYAKKAVFQAAEA